MGKKLKIIALSLLVLLVISSAYLADKSGQVAKAPQTVPITPAPTAQSFVANGPYIKTAPDTHHPAAPVTLAEHHDHSLRPPSEPEPALGYVPAPSPPPPATAAPEAPPGTQGDTQGGHKGKSRREKPPVGLKPGRLRVDTAVYISYGHSQSRVDLDGRHFAIGGQDSGGVIDLNSYLGPYLINVGVGWSQIDTRTDINLTGAGSSGVISHGDVAIGFYRDVLAAPGANTQKSPKSSKSPKSQASSEASSEASVASRSAPATKNAKKAKNAQTTKAASPSLGQHLYLGVGAEYLELAGVQWDYSDRKSAYLEPYGILAPTLGGKWVLVMKDYTIDFKAVFGRANVANIKFNSTNISLGAALRVSARSSLTWRAQVRQYLYQDERETNKGKSVQVMAGWMVEMGP